MSGLRIDAGANRPTGPNRPNLNPPSRPASTPSASEARPSFSLQDAAIARLREVSAKASGATTDDQRHALQTELDSMRAELVQAGGQSPEVVATLAHLSVASENVTAIRPRLGDVEAARTAAQMAQEHIRGSVGDAIRAQANAAARSTRDLLGS